MYENIINIHTIYSPTQPRLWSEAGVQGPLLKAKDKKKQEKVESGK